MKITVNMQPDHDGQYITRWDTDRDPNDKKPTATPEEKKTSEVAPRSTDENDQPRVSTKIWIALRDKENRNYREY